MRVMFREVLPNVLPAMLSIALLGVAIVIVLEGALAIFGLSIAQPDPSWGNMIYSQLSDLQGAGVLDRPVDLHLPDRVLSFNYLGDVVRAEVRRARRRDMSRLRRTKQAERFADAPLDGSLLEVTDVRTHFKIATRSCARGRRCVVLARAGQDDRHRR